MKKRVIAIFLAAIFTFSIFATTVFAVEKKVSVKLPGFSVMLNGKKVDAWHRQYPLIIYKDITYFPMTYHDCRFLGLETQWQADTGLKINKTNITAAYRDDYRKNKNLATYTAAIPSFPIEVNGKVIDNAREEYPLLIFRDVTYFPLTWRFAVDEFGWNYSFDVQKGLLIESDNKKLQAVSLPNYQGQALMIMGDSYVYQGKAGIIYQAALTNPEKAQKIYQLPPSWMDSQSYTRASFYRDNGEYFMMYHTGGATMGTDHYFKITKDGLVEKVLGGNNYSTSKFYNDLQIIAQQGVPPYKNNLVVFDGKETKNIGNPDYIYAWTRGKSSGVSSSRDIYRVQDDLYLLAINDTKEADRSKIYRLNLNTNILTLVSNIDTQHFVLEGDTLYFAKDTKLYKTNLNGGETELLTDDLINQVRNTEDFQTLNGQVYYINENSSLYRLGMNQALNENGKVKMLTRKDQYIVATFEEAANNPYRLMVFDAEGKTVFKTSDVTTTVSVDRDLLAYSIDNSDKIYTIKLK